MTIKQIRALSGFTQKEFSELYGIPLSTLRHWEQGAVVCPSYVIDLLHFRVNFDNIFNEHASKCCVSAPDSLSSFFRLFYGLEDSENPDF